MLLECGIADAYGAGFEFNESAYEANKNDLSDYVRHMGHPGLAPGQYTDDTQMSIALAELLLENNFQQWNKFKIADAFLTAFKRDPRKGYARRFQGFLEQTNNGNEFVANIRPESDKSGSSMRSAVMGVIPDMGTMDTLTRMQAALTHNTANVIASALAVAYASHYFYYRIGKKNDLFDWLNTKIQWNEPSFGDWKGYVGVVGVECVRAAFTALMQTTKMSDLLVKCVSFTGDVDTVAAIAGSVGSVCDEIEQDIPQHLFDKLENKKYGRDYLISLDEKLTSNHPRPAHQAL